MTMQTEYLANWDVAEEQRKADFMEHMYRCSGRTNGVYTGLWKEFCLKEAGPYCRNMYFEQKKAIAEYEARMAEQEEALLKEAEDFKFGIEQAVRELDLNAGNKEFIPTFHD